MCLEVSEQALSELLAGVEVGLLVRNTVGLMDPANRMESWDEEEEGGSGRMKMAVTEKVIPYDLLHSEEAFFWSYVCRSVSPPLPLSPLSLDLYCVFGRGCRLVRYLHKMGGEGDEHMEKLLPTLSDFCIYIHQ